MLGFEAIPKFGPTFVVMTTGMLVTLPSNLVSGLYRARGLYGRAVRLQNWGMLLGQLGQLVAIVMTGSLLACCCVCRSVSAHGDLFSYD